MKIEEIKSIDHERPLVFTVVVFFLCFHRDKQVKYNNNVTFSSVDFCHSTSQQMLHIHLRSTGERFTLKSIHYDTKVRELKTILEIICGVPAHLQLLTYLDEGNLVDSHKLKYYDPVPNCTFELDVWFIYEPIVQAVVANNEAKVMISLRIRTCSS